MQGGSKLENGHFGPVVCHRPSSFQSWLLVPLGVGRSTSGKKPSAAQSLTIEVPKDAYAVGQTQEN